MGVQSLGLGAARSANVGPEVEPSVRAKRDALPLQVGLGPRAPIADEEPGLIGRIGRQIWKADDDRPVAKTKQLEAQDARAYSFLTSVADDLANGKTPDLETMRTWLDSLEKTRSDGHPFGVFEHSLVTYFLKFDTFPHPGGSQSDPELAEMRLQHGKINKRMQSLLQTSWSNLTGKTPSKEKQLERLPWNVLRRLDKKDKTLHDAAFVPVDLTKERIDQREASSLLRDIVPRTKHIAPALAAMGASVASPVAAQIFAGVLIMQAMTSFHEYGVHRVMHPTPQMRKWIDDGPPADAPSWEKALHKAVAGGERSRMKETIEEHNVHHYLTFDTFTQMFSDKRPQERVDKMVEMRFSKEHAETIKREHYAMSLDFKGMVELLPTMIPQSLVGGGLAIAMDAPWMLLAVAAYAVAFPVLTGTLHYIMHFGQDKREDANPLVQSIAGSDLIHWGAKNHHLHHASPNHSSFNVCFPGADAVLGRYLTPNFVDILNMDAEGTVYS